MAHQVELSPRHRTLVVDWMAEVCVKFKLTSETLFMAVQLLDRYLALKTVPRDTIQLVGIATMMIGAKYEEIHTPHISDWVWISADTYSVEDALKMEKVVLLALEFNLTVPNALHFLRRYSKAARSDSEVHTLSKYLCEIAMLEYDILPHLPSRIAAAAVYLARGSAWNKTLEKYTQLYESDLVGVAHQLKVLHQSQRKAIKYNSLFKKYANPKLFSVSQHIF